MLLEKKMIAEGNKFYKIVCRGKFLILPLQKNNGLYSLIQMQLQLTPDIKHKLSREIKKGSSY